VFAFIAVGIIPVLIVSISSSGYFYREMYRVLEEAYQQTAINGMRRLDTMIERYNTISQLLYSYNPEDSDMLRDTSGLGFAMILNRVPENAIEHQQRNNDISAFLSLVQFSDNNIANVAFVEADGSWHVLGQGNRFFIDAGQQWSSGIVKLHNTIMNNPAHPDNRMIIFPTHSDYFFMRPDSHFFTIGRNYLDLSDPVGQERRLGTLYMNINIRAIDDLFRQLELYRYGVILIKDDDNNLIYANPVFYTNNFANNVMEITVYSSIVPWRMIIKMDYYRMMRDVIVINRVMVIIVIVIMISMLIISFFYSKSFLNFISRIRVKEAELGSLKSAIKPHFLYNTLEIIRMNALSNNDPSTADLVMNFAERMRQSVENTKEIVTLAKELEMICDYFSFIDLSHDRRITWAINCDENLDHALVFNLMIQPIVENAVTHGIKPKGKGHIDVNVTKKGKRLLITVKDDGIGMNAETISKLKAKLNKHDFSAKAYHNSIGLKNVHDRIFYYFGEPFGVSIKSAPNHGTEISILLPVISKLNGGGV